MVEGIEGVGITIDFGHANTRGLVPEFAAIADRATHVHIHDNHGASDEHLPLGEGTVPWNIVRKGLEGKYRGFLVIEGRSLAEGARSLSFYREWMA